MNTIAFLVSFLLNSKVPHAMHARGNKIRFFIRRFGTQLTAIARYDQDQRIYYMLR